MMLQYRMALLPSVLVLSVIKAVLEQNSIVNSCELRRSEGGSGKVLYNLVCEFWKLVTGNKVSFYTILCDID